VRRNRSKQRFEIVGVKRLSAYLAISSTVGAGCRHGTQQQGAVGSEPPAAGRRCLILSTTARRLSSRCSWQAPLVVERAPPAAFSATSSAMSPPAAGGHVGIGHPDDSKLGIKPQSQPSWLTTARMISRQARRYRKGLIEHQLEKTIGDRLEVERTDRFHPAGRRAPFSRPHVGVAAQKSEGLKMAGQGKEIPD